MKTLNVPGIHCPKCVARINEALAKAGIDGKADLDSKTVTIPDGAEETVAGLLDDLGFEVK